MVRDENENGSWQAVGPGGCSLPAYAKSQKEEQKPIAMVMGETDKAFQELTLAIEEMKSRLGPVSRPVLEEKTASEKPGRLPGSAVYAEICVWAEVLNRMSKEIRGAIDRLEI